MNLELELSSAGKTGLQKVILGKQEWFGRKFRAALAKDMSGREERESTYFNSFFFAFQKRSLSFCLQLSSSPPPLPSPIHARKSLSFLEPPQPPQKYRHIQFLGCTQQQQQQRQQQQQQPKFFPHSFPSEEGRKRRNKSFFVFFFPHKIQ